MKIFLLTALTMTAFASNSILNRLAVADFNMDPMVFAVIRTGAGAVMLAALVMARQGRLDIGPGGLRGGVALAVYMIGF